MILTVSLVCLLVLTKNASSAPVLDLNNGMRGNIVGFPHIDITPASNSMDVESGRPVSSVSHSTSVPDKPRRGRGRPRLADGAPLDLELLRQARRESMAKYREDRRAILEGRMEPVKAKGRQKNSGSTNVHTVFFKMGRMYQKKQVAKAQAIVAQSGTSNVGGHVQVQGPVASGEMTLEQARKMVEKNEAKKKKDAERKRNIRARIRAGKTSAKASFNGDTTNGHQHEPLHSSMQGPNRLVNGFDLNKMPTSPSSVATER